VRLIGINAPESRNTGRTQVEYFGREAKGYLTKMIAGKSVRLVYDVGRLDRYGRTLAYAYLQDGTFINAEMIRQGYAQVMTIPPNVRYADLFVRLQAEARNNRRGLWK
jgi:micrococcal nuclease